MDFSYILLILIRFLAYTSLKVIMAHTEVAVSNISLPWNHAANGLHKLLNLRYISHHDWKTLSGVNFGTNGLWIAARAKYTPIISWEGCARWNSSCKSDTVSAGSLGDCLSSCQGNTMYIMLKGDVCRCIEKSETCIQRTTDRCDDKCQNNPNDWCGGEIGTEALYRTGPFDIIAPTTKRMRAEGSSKCFTLRINRDSKGIIHEGQCERFISRSICKNDSDTFSVYNAWVSKNWFEAHEVCKNSNASLYFDLPKKRLKPSKYQFWTSLKRGLSIKWTNSKDSEYPPCVSMRLYKQRLSFYAEDCNAKRKYLFLTRLQNYDGSETIEDVDVNNTLKEITVDETFENTIVKDTFEDTNIKATSIPSWQLVLFGMLPMAAIVGVLVFLLRKRFGMRNDNHDAIASQVNKAEGHYTTLSGRPHDDSAYLALNVVGLELKQDIPDSCPCQDAASQGNDLMSSQITQLAKRPQQSSEIQLTGSKYESVQDDPTQEPIYVDPESLETFKATNVKPDVLTAYDLPESPVANCELESLSMYLDPEILATYIAHDSLE